MTEWRSVVGFEGVYEVSDDGQVRSLDRRVPYRYPGQTKLQPGRPIKAFPHRKGHLIVGLRRPRERRRFQGVHRLMAEAFLGDLWFPGAQVCHNDGNPTNNTIDNLRWGTPRDNQLDAVKHGVCYWRNRTHCKNGHPFDEKNTTWKFYANGTSLRRCRACGRIRSAEARARKKAVAA